MTNVIPNVAQMELDVRTLPTVSHSKILETVEGIFKCIGSRDSNIRFELEVLNDRPAVETAAESAIVSRMQGLLRRRGMDCTPKGLYFYTDMSQIVSRRSCPFVIFGPGDDKQAHQLDEHVKISSVATFAEVYTDYVSNFYFGGLA